MNNRMVIIITLAVCLLALRLQVEAAATLSAQTKGVEPNPTAKSDRAGTTPTALVKEGASGQRDAGSAPSGSAVVTTSRGKVNASVGQNVSVGEGETVDSVATMLGSATISGHVTGDVVAVLGDVRLKPGAVVDGDVISIGGRIAKDASATIGGEHHSVRIGDMRRWLVPSVAIPTIFGVLHVVGESVLIALLMAIVVALFPARMEYVAATALDRPGPSAMYGIIAILLVFPVAVGLAVTCVGIPLIGLELILIWLASFVGNAGICIALGRRICEAVGRPISEPVRAVVVGRFVVGFVYLIPVLGTIIGFALSVIGLGAILLTRFGLAPAAEPELVLSGSSSAMTDGERM